MATTESPAGATAIRPFTVEIPDAEVEDLRARIVATRLPEKEPVKDASQGVQLATMQALVRYWGTEYIGVPWFHLARDHAGRGDPGNDGDRNFSFRASEPDCAAVLIRNSGR